MSGRAKAPVGSHGRTLLTLLLDGPISPMLATPGRALPEGSGWVLEPKWDGWRALAHVTPNGPRIFTRHGKGHHRRLPALNAALAELPLARSSTASSSACNRSRAGGSGAASIG